MIGKAGKLEKFKLKIYYALTLTHCSPYVSLALAMGGTLHEKLNVKFNHYDPLE